VNLMLNLSDETFDYVKVVLVAKVRLPAILNYPERIWHEMVCRFLTVRYGLWVIFFFWGGALFGVLFRLNYVSEGGSSSAFR
jgi:hypothetical protein